jgi:hypothetical protein
MRAQRIKTGLHHVGAALAALSVASPASSLTAAELYRICTQPRNSNPDIGCNYYILGLTDGNFLGDSMASSGNRFCAPKNGVDHAQARLVIEKFFRDHPEELHEEAGGPGYTAGNRCWAASAVIRSR